jgi:ATP-binding cassette, subfamily C, bacterial CydD
MSAHKRLFNELGSFKALLLFAAVLIVLAGATTVLQASLLSQAIARIFLQHHHLRDVRPILCFFLLAVLLRLTSQWFGQNLLYSVSARIKRNIRSNLSEHLLRLGPAYTSGQSFGTIKAVLTTGIERLDAFFSEYVPQIFSAVLIPLLILVFVFSRDHLSALVLLLTAPLIPFFMLLIGDVATRHTQLQWQALTRLNNFFTEVLQGILTIKILGCSQDLRQKIDQVTNEFKSTTLSVLRIAFLSALTLELLSTLSIAILAVEIGLRLLYDKMAYQQALFILILAPEFYLPLRRLGAHFHAGLDALAAANSMEKIFAEQPVEQVGACIESSVQQVIQFENVSYQYPGMSQLALNSISLRLQPGQKTALVGPNGAGKSTLVALLLRFITPLQGEIRIGEQSLLHIDPVSWRAHLAWVPQRPFLFHASVAENIRLADPQAGSERIVQAAKQAHLHETIEKLPQGYDTLIGERGVRLSIGQAQRLALSRAFLKKAPLLILDEPTSGLDRESETALASASALLIQDKTVLTIAHRLHTIARYDQILFMEQGQILERGTHQELLAMNGRYAEFTRVAGVIV